MRNSNSALTRRIAAGIMGLMMLVIVLFSAFFIIAEANHDCTGEDCPVCACIEQCENTLRGIGDGTVIQSSVMIPVLFALLTALLYGFTVSPETPVSRKVRLNN